MIFYYFAFLLISLLGSVHSQDSKPNIIFILADDLGTYDEILLELNIFKFLNQMQVGMI